MNATPLSALLLLLTFASPALAQLDLPDKAPPKPKQPGVELGGRPRGDVSPKPGVKGSGRIPDLRDPAAQVGELPELAPVQAEAPSSAVEAILAELAEPRGVNAGVVADAVRSLNSMGGEGLAAARANLDSEAPSTILACAETLLAGGDLGDQLLVLRRVHGKLPNRAAVPLVDLLDAKLPAEESLELLIELSEHRQGGLRRQAVGHLTERSGELNMGHLLALMSSERTDTRRLAYQMMADMDYPGVEDRLFDGLGDKAARAAWQAADSLADRVETPTDALAQRIAARARLVGAEDRAGAFALLAAVEVEDRLGAALLPFSDSINLLLHLRAGSPLVSAASAVALAGIGFRAESPANWLDIEVTNALVKIVAGNLYFAEFGIVRPGAMRRLGQITGKYFGDDGPRWQQWWADSASEFRALRAVIPVAPGEYEWVEVRWLDPAEAQSFRLLGSLADEGSEPFAGQTLRLVPEDSRALMRDLAAAGVFGAERLPGLLGRATGVERQLEVRLGDQAKVFRFGDGADEVWSQQIVTKLLEFEAAASWQLFPTSEYGLTPEGRKAFFQAESPWWNGEHDAGQRARRLARLMVDHMTQLEVHERDRALSQLIQTYALEGVASPEDFPLFVSMLGEEAFFGARARRLLELCLASVASEGEQLADERAGELIDLLYVRADAMRLEPLTRVLGAAGPRLQREAAVDPRSTIRAVAAAVLAQRGEAAEAEDFALLAALLSDAAVEVESAAVLSVASAGFQRFRDDVQLRARVGDPLVRQAALRGVGMLGGEGSLEVLRLAVLEQDQRLRSAGAEALAELADPASATLLVSMLAGGEAAPFFEPARRGLLAIGEPAWDALFGLARTRTSPARRDAALLLSQQSVAEVASILITMLTEDSSDLELAAELALLTGYDYRMTPDPAGKWWAWHDSQRGDAYDWFCDAVNYDVEQGLDLGLASIRLRLDAASLRGKGSIEGARDLLALLRQGTQAHYEDRAKRELRRLLGAELVDVPPIGRLRTQWCDVLEARLPELLEPLATPAEELGPVEVGAADAASGEPAPSTGITEG